MDVIPVSFDSPRHQLCSDAKHVAVNFSKKINLTKKSQFFKLITT